MEIENPVWSALAAVAALLAAAGAVGLVVVAGSAEPAAVAMLLLCAAFFAASAFPTIRAHPAYTLLNAGYVAALFTLWYLVVRASPGVGSVAVDAIGAFAVLAAGGLLVELYNYRHGTSYLRLE
jgi:hypothetical protein